MATMSESSYSSPLLPDFLCDSYERYKADTTAFLTWLVTTARVTGYEADVEHPIDQKAPRLKGKARIVAKQSSSASRAQDHIVTVNQIVLLARHVVSASDKKSYASHAVLSIVERAISARQRCARWFQTQDNVTGTTAASNQSHSYFTDVLAEALDILQRHKTQSAAPTQGTGTRSLSRSKTTDKKVSSNPFEGLDVEEVEDVEGENIICWPGSDRSPILEHAYNREADNQEEDLLFAVYCMLDDMKRIRDFIARTWQQYLAKEISLMNAAACTNTAIEFARGIEQRLLTDFPQVSDWNDILDVILPVLDNRYNLRSGGASGEQLEVKNSIYFLPSQRLAPYCNLLKDSVPNPPLGAMYDLQLDWNSSTPLEQWCQDHIFLQQFLIEYVTVFSWKLPARDVASIGLLETISQGKLHLWVAFAFQICLDIRHTMGNEVDRGAKELRVHGQKLKDTFTSLTKREPVANALRKTGQVKSLQWHLEFVEENVLKDSLNKLRYCDYQNGMPPRGCYGAPFFFLSQHPLMCGTIQFSLTLSFQNAAISLTDITGIVTAAAHLYNAARKEEMMKATWQEMDELLHAFSPEKMFLGTRPENPEAFKRRYLLLMGISPETFAGNRRPHTIKKDTKRLRIEVQNAYTQSKKGVRKVFQFPSALGYFLKWYSCDNVQPELTVEHIESMLSQVGGQIAIHPTTRKALKWQWDKSRRLEPSDLLILLQKAIAKEEALIEFDFLGLLGKCAEMLLEIERPVHEAFLAWFNLFKSKKENFAAFGMLHRWPQYVFEALSSDKEDIMAIGQFLLQHTGQVMQDYLESEKKPPQIDTSRQDVGSWDQYQEEEDMPDISPATLWGILLSSHPTRNGRCHHFGLCIRQWNEIRHLYPPPNINSKHQRRTEASSTKRCCRNTLDTVRD